MKYPKHGSRSYRLLAVLIWRPYYWIRFRPEPELRMFMIRRRIWGGERISIERRNELAELRRNLAGIFEKQPDA